MANLKSPGSAEAKSVRNEKTPEDITHEYPALGRYRVRVIKKKPGSSPSNVLDIREYVSADNFVGFTRRGIRLLSEEEINQLRDALADCVARGWLN